MDTISRRKFLQTAGIASLGTAVMLSAGCSDKVNLQLDKSQPDFTFVHLTDIHLQPESKAYEGFLKAIETINNLHPRPAFCITGGDLVMDALGVNFERANLLYNMYSEAKKKLKMPVYDVLGNHECFGVYEESGIIPDHPEYGKEMFKKRLGNGRTYSSFDYQGWHFMLLDTIGLTADRKYIGELSSNEIEWMKADLQNTGADTPVVMVSHIPLVTALPEYLYPFEKSDPSWQVTNTNEIAPELEKHNVKLVLSGHLHMVESWLYKSMNFTCSGAVCGSWWGGDYRGFQEGFTLVSVKGGEAETEYIDYGWTVEMT